MRAPPDIIVQGLGHQWDKFRKTGGQQQPAHGQLCSRQAGAMPCGVTLTGREHLANRFCHIISKVLHGSGPKASNKLSYSYQSTYVRQDLHGSAHMQS